MNPPKLPTTLAPNASALFDTHGTLTVLFITQWMKVMSEISKVEGLSHLAAPVLATLRNLVRDHLLHFRLEVGRVILDTFFNGSAAAYGDKNPNKESTFNDFLAQNAAELDELGLKPWLLRQCVQVQIVYRTLPSTVRDDLGFSRTLALVKVGDPTMRARLANDALAKRLTLNQFQDVVDSAIAGTWYDTDPATTTRAHRRSKRTPPRAQ